MFEIGKTYKIEDVDGIFYTATITEETQEHISFIDYKGNNGGLKLGQIKRWKEVEQHRESEN